MNERSETKVFKQTQLMIYLLMRKELNIASNSSYQYLLLLQYFNSS